MEPIFDIGYLITVISVGIQMIRKSTGRSRQFTLF